MNVLNEGIHFVKFVKIFHAHVTNVVTQKQHQPTLCFIR